jgi:uncharacterized lipoprotein YddW (UPF0748 family)
MVAYLFINPVQAQETYDIEACNYADNQAAQIAWTARGGSDPVTLSIENIPDGSPALSFLCDLPRLSERAYWDRNINMDLSRFDRIAFWIKVIGAQQAVRQCSLHFRSGSGWYTANQNIGFGLPMQGWQHVILNRADFVAEGTPTSWSSIDCIRFSSWKGADIQATILLGAVEGISDDVIVVRNTRAGTEAASAKVYAGKMTGALSRAGIGAGMVDEASIETGMLAGKSIVIYPYNPVVSSTEITNLNAFVDNGGKIIACYKLVPDLASILGVQSQGYKTANYKGHFSSMRFPTGHPVGFPDIVLQISTSINNAGATGGNGSYTAATWYDGTNWNTGYAAVILNNNGAFLTGALQDDDCETKAQLLYALLGTIRPDMWQYVAEASMSRAGNISSWTTFTDAAAEIWNEAVAQGRVNAQNEVTQAQSFYSQADLQYTTGDYPQVVEPATAARQHLLSAYACCQMSAANEFRGVWSSSAYYPNGMTWDAAVAKLKDNGFNAVIPNMAKGGLADYNSQVLPVNSRVAMDGDQIALCVTAGKKYDVAVHVWKICWNLAGAPATWINSMRTAGRLQQTYGGTELTWLCPSHPDNQALERDAVLEIVNNYDIDGIHLDYIRYPWYTYCYCDGCRQRFEAASGLIVHNWPADVLINGLHYMAYQDFRRAQISGLVQEISQSVRLVKPDVKISAAVSGSWPSCRDNYGQDWVGWMDNGWLDFVCPMNYTLFSDIYGSIVQAQYDLINGGVSLFSGVGASDPGLCLDKLIDQIKATRTTGTGGFILFDYSSAGWINDFLPALKQGLTAD